jgi:hypothetical protein
MTIYVSISCLGIDRELIHTIRSAKDQALDPDSISMGIAFIGTSDLFEQATKKRLEPFGYSNITTLFAPIGKEEEGIPSNLGVSKGRRLAHSLYKGEDYFLQIDAHTRFQKGWDQYLISQFKRACKTVANQRVVLSGYPPAYWSENPYTHDYSDGILGYKTNQTLSYPKFLVGKFCLENFRSIPKFANSTPDVFGSSLIEEINKTGFAPLWKVSAAFMFGDSSLGKDTRIEQNAVFWDEEITQSINLIADGFTLVYPGPTPVLYHLYLDNVPKEPKSRTSLFDLISNEEIIEEETHTQFTRYITAVENRDKVTKYEDYLGFTLTDGPSLPNLYPKTYINIGYEPIEGAPRND